jgi:hypothetical protein
MSLLPHTDDDSSSSTWFLQPSRVAAASQHILVLMPIQLTKENYLLWKSLFIPILRANNMLNLAEGREPCPPQFLTTSTQEEKECGGGSENPAYTNWIKRDQTFLTWINASLSVTLLRYTAECTSGRALWLHLESLLAENARSNVLELKTRLKNLDMTKPPCSFSAQKYIELAKQMAEDLEAAGSLVDDSVFVSCVLEGLPSEYDDFVASIRDRPQPVTREELHDLLISYSHTIPLPIVIKIIFICGILFIGLVTSLRLVTYLRERNHT